MHLLKDALKSFSSLNNSSLSVIVRLLIYASCMKKNVSELTEEEARKFFQLETLEDWEKAWSPLIKNKLVTREHENNYFNYKIYLSKISELKDIEIKLIISSVYSSTEKSPMFKQILEEKTKLLASSNKGKLDRAIEGLIKELEKRNKKFTVEQLLILINTLMKFHERVVESTLDVYNESYWGKKGIDYLFGILKNKAEEIVIMDKTKMNNKKNIDRKKVADLKFAVDLALGKISQDNITYRTLIENNNFDKLRDFWDLGRRQLAKMNREAEVIKKYGWLE